MGKAAWTDLPEDFKKMVIEVLSTHFKAQMKTGKFMIEGRIYKNEIVMRCGYLPNDSIKPIQFDMSMDYDSKAKEPLKYFESLVDLGASLIETYFQNPNEEFPLLWTPIEFSGQEIFFKQDGTNSELEEMANQILGEDELDDGLVHGDLESDEIEKITETLNQKKNQTH